MKFSTLTAAVLVAAIAALSNQAAAALPASSLIDVKLHPGGILVGIVTDSAGLAVADGDVVLSQAKKIVATTKTRKDGTFTINGVKGGVYQIETIRGHGIVRVWTPQTAPPHAVQAVQVFESNQVVRGNIEYEGGGVGPVETAGVLLGAAGVTLGIIAWEEAKDNGS